MLKLPTIKEDLELFTKRIKSIRDAEDRKKSEAGLISELKKELGVKFGAENKDVTLLVKLLMDESTISEEEERLASIFEAVNELGD
jgi:hypothetical protein